MKKLSMDELQRSSIKEFKNLGKHPLVVVLDSVRSMSNVGSIFRTCDGFAVEKLYLCGITAQPPHKEITKTALGATDSVDWEYHQDVVELVNQLKNDHYTVFLIEQTDNSIMLDQYQYQPQEKIAIILGNEVFGVDERLLPLCDGVIEIPQYGTKHSFNVTIAGGIVIWEIVKQMEF
ncbi:MAG TPA: RNA methyltransferase [Bacteroidales bacterium]|nr:RNA methyltransferase [Bacteroidales bacterium]HPS72328.1 RNA methyltransferase [Bacteroidales bacterium]